MPYLYPSNFVTLHRRFPFLSVANSDISLVVLTRHPPPPLPLPPTRQLDIVLNFFVGYYKDGVYVDDLAAIARRYVGSPSRFWCGPRQRLKPVAAFGLLYSPRRRRRNTLNGNR